MGAADLVERGALSQDSIHNIVLMGLTGAAIGYVTELGRTAELTLVRAQRLEAATRERQRLARDIHDGVLQVLALVQRRGAEIGGAGPRPGPHGRGAGAGAALAGATAGTTSRTAPAATRWTWT